MKIKQSFQINRRGFLRQVTIVSGAAYVASALPLSSPLLASTRIMQVNGLYATGYTSMDEALGNYPHYSETIGFGRGHHLSVKESPAPLEGLLAL